MCWEEATEMISTIEVANEMKSAIKIATQVITVTGVVIECILYYHYSTTI